MVTISPDLMTKLSPETRMHIDRFFENALELDKSIEKCGLVMVDRAFNMKHHFDEASSELTKDFNAKRITYDEETHIGDRIRDFHTTKMIGFIKGLEKCGCKFK